MALSETTPWIGANFWSRTGGPRMWSRYDGSVVREELAVLARHGCNMTRSFCYWPDFVPAAGVLDEAVLERFGDFLEAHRELALGTVPTFLVGHMSGQNWDPAWRNGRDLHRDVWMVSQEAWFAAELAARFGDHPSVVGWLVSNEMPLYGGPATVEEITAWARLVVQAVRSTGASQPVSLGDGAWGVEVTGRDNGYSLRALAGLVDFVGPHVYPMQDDQLRELLSAAFACELAGGFDLPVVLEEFGLTSDFSSNENAADYYRHVLHSTLLAGARGWIAWNNCDYDDLEAEDPYRHHVFELHFGLTDAAGRPKPQLDEMARFSRLVGELGETGWSTVPAEAAIVVPEHFERELPFTVAAYRDDLRKSLFQGYVAPREADLPVAFDRELDGLETPRRLYLNPSAKLLTGPGWRRLQELARGGATVYTSYFAGSTESQRGPWMSWLPEIFGVRHLLRYGLVDPILEDEVELELVEPLGDLVPGDVLRFATGGSESARSYLPVDPVDAKVLAVDLHGRPAILRQVIGAGATVLCTYPIEYLAASRPRANPEDSWRLYAALAVAAGIERPVRAPDPRVLVGRLQTGRGERVVVANCSPEPLQAELLTAAGVQLGRRVDGGVLGPTLELGPFAVEVLYRQ